MLLPFETRFAQNVDAEIRKEQTKLLNQLGAGTLLNGDAATVGMKCAAAIAKVQGLQIALDIMQSVHKEMTGPGKTEKAKD